MESRFFVEAKSFVFSVSGWRKGGVFQVVFLGSWCTAWFGLDGGRFAAKSWD
jgi:hypothetical protein